MIVSLDRWRVSLTCLVVYVSMWPTDLLAAGGTSIVASPGQPASVSTGWPEGVGELVNDPARTTGWNSWFTEWPNDVNQYAFEIKTMGDLNRLIQKTGCPLNASSPDILWSPTASRRSRSRR
jgi:hypothetical protein